MSADRYSMIVCSPLDPRDPPSDRLEHRVTVRLSFVSGEAIDLSASGLLLLVGRPLTSALGLPAMNFGLHAIGNQGGPFGDRDPATHPAATNRLVHRHIHKVQLAVH